MKKSVTSPCTVTTALNKNILEAIQTLEVGSFSSHSAPPLPLCRAPLDMADSLAGSLKKKSSIPSLHKIETPHRPEQDDLSLQNEVPEALVKTRGSMSPTEILHMSAEAIANELKLDTNGGGAWDTDEESSTEGDQTIAPLSLANGTLTCTRGQRGVSSLALAPYSAEFMNMATIPERPSSAPLSHVPTNWVRGAPIGQGSLGTVFQALDPDSGQVIAVKEVRLDTKDSVDQKRRAELENEIKICEECRHPRIVSFLGHEYKDGFLYIFMEHMAGGSLAQVLAQFGALEESLIHVYTKSMLEGLVYLHSKHPPVVHRDIKSANVLVGLDCSVKLADFGCSKSSDVTLSHTLRGSIPWMAPEVVNGRGYGRAADVWSFGCVIIEMATAALPWGKVDNPMALLFRIARSDLVPEAPACLSDVAQEFVRCCLRRSPEERSTATTLLEHEMLRYLSDDT